MSKTFKDPIGKFDELDTKGSGGKIGLADQFGSPEIDRIKHKSIGVLAEATTKTEIEPKS